MRRLLLSAAVAALAVACSPPAQNEAEAPRERPVVEACNSVTPNPALQVAVQEELAVASAASELRGGRIAPGTYDLASAHRIGRATGWQGTRAVALEVSEAAAGGVTFNWAGTTDGPALDTWTANFSDAGEHPMLSYTCGRIGEVAAEFTAQQDALTLRVPDGANGSLQLSFARRS